MNWILKSMVVDFLMEEIPSIRRSRENLLQMVIADHDKFVNGDNVLPESLMLLNQSYANVAYCQYMIDILTEDDEVELDVESINECISFCKEQLKTVNDNRLSCFMNAIKLLEIVSLEVQYAKS